MANILANVQSLLSQAKGEGQMLSAYIDTASFAGGPAVWPGPVKHKADAIAEMMRDDEAAQMEFDRNLQAIGRALEAPALRYSPGVAVFAALQRGFMQTFPLEFPPVNELVVDPSPYLVPLLQSLIRHRDFLLVLSDSHRARICAVSAGSIRVLRELEAEVPKKQHSCGERWGKEQATIARYRDDCVRHFHKVVTEAIEQLWAEQTYAGVLFFGEHTVVEHLKAGLPARIVSRVIMEKAQPWVDDVATLRAASRNPILEYHRAEEAKVLEVVAGRLREGYGIASGPASVLEAVRTGAVGPRGHGYLVLASDPREVVGRCPRCRSLHVDAPKTCPNCQVACVESNLWEEVLLLALRHDIAVQCVGTAESLAARGGMVAVLGEARPGVGESPPPSAKRAVPAQSARV